VELSNALKSVATRRLAVATAAAVVAALTVGIVAVTGDDPAAQAGDPPPLSLVLVGSGQTARDLRSASNLYERGRLAEARALFDRHGTPEARVGSAYSRWPDETIARLEELPASGVSVLHLGIAYAVLGREADARNELARASRVAPDTPYAIRADDLLHPRMVPGLPFFVPQRPPRGALRAGLESQRLGRPVSARRAFDEAARRAPNDPEALVAAAVGRFEKDRPAAAFSRLGPLTRRFPRSQTVRFHLGLLLLWIGAAEEARTQLERAVALDRDSRFGRDAKRILDRLEGGTS
jgi:tetratricopeptide (TPR) repeat protein